MMKGGTPMSESADRGRGRVFRPPGRKVWMLAYYGPKTKLNHHQERS